MNDQIDPKHIINSLVRQRDEALAKVVQLEAVLAMTAEKNEKKAEHKPDEVKVPDIEVGE